MSSSSHITLPHLRLQSFFRPTYQALSNFAPQFTHSAPFARVPPQARPCIICCGCAFDFYETCGPAFAADDRGTHL
ncbi:hypothetical protein CY34DRAFT_814160 [Suillus luteus UH-Slu-Lm8-n1]|uniref:Uncharacterized protein n=1 Tax=Suillus luteus UH-Slu-Lm8-n1 TaxID=930992 RepID=A0A0D0AL57_9AGAM|nr:hypothetical protein CY34DRAFT_814160 [Suillus luteus UH-Slu-Lm8-n1]